METLNSNIVACYLYIITKYGYPPSAANTLSHLDELKNLGLKSIELEGIRKEHLEEIHSLSKQVSLKADKLELEIPVFCIVLPGLSSADSKEREDNLLLFEKGCEAAVNLKSKIVLDNSPIPPWQFPKGIPVARHYDEEVLASASLPKDLVWNKYQEELVETFREVCDIAAKYKLNYHLHPCYGALVNSTDAYINFAEAVQRDNLKFNLDTANQFFMKDNLFLSLLRLKDHIDYIHISDNRGHRVEHLAVGDGNIKWDQFFETLDRINYKGMFGIDVGGAESDVANLDKAYRSSAEWITEKWFKHKNH